MSEPSSVLEAILHRRSALALSGPPPTPEQLELLLRAAATVPDHGMLRPYRFVVIRPDGRDRFGDALASAAKQARPELGDGLLEKVKRKAHAAPLQIAILAAPRLGHSIPEWEQVATAACTGYAIVLAAHAQGLGAAWKSAAAVDGVALRDTLEMQPGERLLGWINLGQAAPNDLPRPPAPLAPLVRELTADGLRPYTPPDEP
jgi:nitroreductase